MCSVEGIQACTSQAGGDDDPIPVREYTVYVRQYVTQGMGSMHELLVASGVSCRVALLQ